MTKLTYNFYKRKIEQEKQIVKDLKQDKHYVEVGMIQDHIKWLKKQQTKLEFINGTLYSQETIKPNKLKEIK